MSLIKSALILFLFILSFNKAESQNLPLKPFSNPVFNPFILNPAVAGSRDYSSVNLIAGFQNELESQLFSAEGRISKPSPLYSGSSEFSEFTGFAVGGALFHGLSNNVENTGSLASVAYHLPVDKYGLSFLSFGLSVKGVQSIIKYQSADTFATPRPDKKIIHPNLDLGAYYYSPGFYAGISTNNILGNPEGPDSLGRFDIPVSQQYFIHTGYKILLQRSLNIVLEPSVIYSPNDSTYNKLYENIQPLIKLYLLDFCLGTYFNNKENFSVFFQYKYPRFNLGGYFEFPKKSAFNITKPVIELKIGLNLYGRKIRQTEPGRW